MPNRNVRAGIDDALPSRTPIVSSGCGGYDHYDFDDYHDNDHYKMALIAIMKALFGEF
jgi:hypothetical protein